MRLHITYSGVIALSIPFIDGTLDSILKLSKVFKVNFNCSSAEEFARWYCRALFCEEILVLFWSFLLMLIASSLALGLLDLDPAGVSSSDVALIAPHSKDIIMSCKPKLSLDPWFKLWSDLCPLWVERSAAFVMNNSPLFNVLLHYWVWRFLKESDEFQKESSMSLIN